MAEACVDTNVDTKKPIAVMERDRVKKIRKVILNKDSGSGGLHEGRIPKDVKLTYQASAN